MGGCSFAVLGLLPHAPLLVLGVLAVLAGAAPAAAPGGLRTLLISQLPDTLVVTALSAESVLIYGYVDHLARSHRRARARRRHAGAALLAAGLMAAAAAGLWALPAGWQTDGGDHEGASMARTLARAWPIYVTGAASVSLLALAELVLPALLHQRAIDVGWAGPLLAGFSVAAVARRHPVRPARELARLAAHAERDPAAWA